MSPLWAKNLRAVAGRLRRAQTFLRMLDIEIAFGRERRSGARMIRMSTLGRERLVLIEGSIEYHRYARQIAEAFDQLVISRIG